MPHTGQAVPENPQRPAAKIFAWAGLRFRLPAGWGTGQLTRDHGWFESDFKPTLEFKTAVIKGHFSFRRHLQRLKQASSLRLHPRDLPPAWRAYLTTFQVQAFNWQGPHQAGDGFLIYCPDCRRATLMQFFRNPQTPSSIETVLASFDDHGSARRPTVAVYDIQVSVPDSMPLERFRFDSGAFQLVFGGAGRRLNLWRWSPADVALRHHGDSLVNFARRHRLAAGTALPASPQSSDQGLEWRWPPSRSWHDRLSLKIKRRLSPAILRIWHLPTANRILAVRADGNWDEATFTEICGSYAIIS
jgi:hypothetical protein